MWKYKFRSDINDRLWTYRIFVAVAEEENITKASDKLNISQPAITKQIKNLENQLSVKLFERKNKGVD